jgi:hypothetical protein
MSCIRLLFPQITYFALRDFCRYLYRRNGLLINASRFSSTVVLASFHLALQCFIIVLFPQLLQVLSVCLAQHAQLVLVSTHGSPASPVLLDVQQPVGQLYVAIQHSLLKQIRWIHNRGSTHCKIRGQRFLWHILYIRNTRI